MKRKTLISVVLLIIMLLSCISPVLRVYATESSAQTITLNSELYTAVSTYMKSNYTGFAYNDLLRTISANGADFSDVDVLYLENSEIDDLSGLEAFTNLKELYLSGNYLSLDSNLEVINNFSNMEFLDLSSNQIDGFSWLTLANKEEFDYDSQKIDKVQVFKIEVPYEEDENGNKVVKEDFDKVSEELTGLIPEILKDAEAKRFLTDGNKYDGPDYIEHSSTTTKENIRISDDGVISFSVGDVVEKDGKNVFDVIHKEENNMYHLKLEVTDSSEKYFGSEINLYVIVAYDDEEAITFKDENFYKSVKNQLKKGQTINSDLQEDTDVERLYEEAYDTALTLVIDESDITNKIKSLICDNERISDLTGLEYFIGLESNFSAKYNYIDTIEKVVELEENKAKKEAELRKAISDKISQFNSDYTYGYANLGITETINIAKELENYKLLQEGLAAIEEKEYKDTTSGDTTVSAETQKNNDIIAEYKKYGYGVDSEEIDVTTLEKEVLSNMKSVCSKAWDILDELYDIKNESVWLRTFLIPELYKLTFGDIDLLSDADASNYIINQIDKFKNMETQCLYKNCINNSQTSLSTPSLATYIQYYMFENTEDSIETLSDDFSGVDSKYKTMSFNAYLEENLNKLNEKLNDKNLKFRLLKIFEKIDEICYTKSLTVIRGNLDDTKYYKISEDFGENNIMLYYFFVNSLIFNNNAEMLEAVIKLPRLKNLDLSYNNIESLEDLNKVKELEYINFNSNLITTIDNVVWKELSKLTVINLSNNQLTNIECLEKDLNKIASIDLSSNLLSGKFDFEFWNYPTLKYLDFSYNSYTDLSIIIDKYKKDVEEDIDTIKELLVEGLKIDLKFHNQVIKVNYGTVTPKSDGSVKLQLPPIFEQVNIIDPYNTTYGVSSKYGSVEQFGELVKYTNYENGNNSGYVTIQNIDDSINNADKKVSIGNGTICNIEYNIGGTVTPDDSTGTNTPTDPETPPATDDNTGKIPEGTQELTAEDVVIYDDGDSNRFIYVYKPDATVASLADVILNDSEYTINSINGSKDFENDNSRLFTSESVALTTEDAFEIIVVGDIDGDGDIDTTDSGYARALRYGSLYKDIKDEDERSALMNAFEETSNFRAADFYLAEDGKFDGTVDKKETRAILLYRAGLLENFNGFAPKD